MNSAFILAVASLSGLLRVQGRRYFYFRDTMILVGRRSHARYVYLESYRKMFPPYVCCRIVDILS